MSLKLYQNKLSPNAKRIRVLANELKLTCEVIELDFAKGEHKTPSYLALNPMGKVPTIVDDNITMWESPAIMMHLAAKHKSELLPTDAVSLGETGRWMFWNASHFEPGVFTVAFERLFAPMFGRAGDDAKIASGCADIGRYAPILNAHLAKGPWMLGNQFTIADIAMGTTVETAMMAGKELEPYANIRSWYGRLSERTCWKA